MNLIKLKAKREKHNIQFVLFLDYKSILKMGRNITGFKYNLLDILLLKTRLLLIRLLTLLTCKFKYKFKLLIAAIIVVVSFQSSGLSAAITIVDFDSSNYPAVTCKFIPIDDWNRLISVLPQEQIKFLDNGGEMLITNYTQSKISELAEDGAAIVVSFDLAIGHRSENIADFNYAKTALDEMFSFINTNTTKTALLSFDQMSVIESDFTDATNSLVTISDNFIQSKSSNIFNGLSSKFTGAIEFLGTSSCSVKSLILVTQELISYDEMVLLINKAQTAGINIYVLYISGVVPENIKQLALETGGYALGRNEIDKKRSAAISSIVKLAEGYTPFEITSISNINCDGNHAFLLQTQDAGSNNYLLEIEQENLQYIEASPAYLDYLSILPGSSFERTIKIFAKNGPININSISLAHPNFSITSIVPDVFPGSPVLLQPEESLEITIKFSPQDSSIVFAQLVIFSDACSGDTINITGGYPNVPPKEKTIKITSPKCGEVVVLGEPVDVTWTGLLPKDVIQLEYVYGDDKKWDTLGRNVTNLKYSWQPPIKETDSLRIRAIQLWPNNVYKTYDLKHNAFVTTAFFNNTGDRIISTCGKLKQAYIWNASTGDSLFTFEFGGEVTWAKYMFDPVMMQDKYIGITAGDSVYLYSALDNSLLWSRKLNSTVNSIEFSKDGLYLVVSSNDGYLSVFETNSGGIKFSTKTSGFNCRYAQFHPTRKYEIMAVASSGGIIRFFDINGTKIDSIDIKEGLSNAQVQYATYNQSGTKIAYTNITTKKLVVLDAANKSILYRISHPEEDVIISFADFLSTSAGEYILTSASDRTLRRWKASDGSPADKDNLFDQHHNIINTGVFSFDGKRVLSASNDYTAKIWNLDQRILQADTTCYLRVSRAKIKYQDTINIGEAYIGQLAAKTISNIIINNTEIPKFKFNIKSIKIIGDNVDEFGIVDNFKFPILLSANIGLDLNLFFSPARTGQRVAKLEIILPADTVYITIMGTGISQEVRVLTSLIDFEKISIDDYKDTLAAIAVNNSNKEININSFTISGINYINFREFTEDNIKLAPKDTLKVPIRFIPFVDGKKNALLKINYDYDYDYDYNTTTQIKLNLLGIGGELLNDSISISIKNISADVGELVELPIYYETITNSPNIFVNRIFVTLSFNSSMLAPVNESTEINILDDEILAGIRSILISMPYKPGKQTVNGLKFIAALGNNSTTTLELKNTYCEGSSRVYTKSTGAKFTLNNICHADGERLFDEYGRISLYQNVPNPANNYTVIDYEVAERGGVTTIKLYNQAGELVKVLLDSEVPVGKHQIKLDLSNLATGKYYYVLKTPTTTETRSMIIEK